MGVLCALVVIATVAVPGAITTDEHEVGGDGHRASPGDSGRDSVALRRAGPLLEEELRFVPQWAGSLALQERRGSKWHRSLLHRSTRPTHLTSKQLEHKVRTSDLTIICDRHDLAVGPELAARAVCLLGEVRNHNIPLHLLLEIVEHEEQEWIEGIWTLPGHERWDKFRARLAPLAAFGLRGYATLIQAAAECGRVVPSAVGVRRAPQTQDEEYGWQVVDSVRRSLSRALRMSPRGPAVLLLGADHVLGSPSILDEPVLSRESYVVLVPAQVQWQATLLRRFPEIPAGDWVEVAPSVFCEVLSCSQIESYAFVSSVGEARAAWEARRIRVGLSVPSEAWSPGSTGECVSSPEEPSRGHAVQSWRLWRLASADRVDEIRRLSYARPTDRPAIEYLIQVCQGPDRRARTEACFSIRMIAPVHPQSVLDVCDLLAEVRLSRGERRDLLFGLARRVSCPEVVVPELVKELEAGLSPSGIAEVVPYLLAYGRRVELARQHIRRLLDRDDADLSTDVRSRLETALAERAAE